MQMHWRSHCVVIELLISFLGCLPEKTGHDVPKSGPAYRLFLFKLRFLFTSNHHHTSQRCQHPHRYPPLYPLRPRRSKLRYRPARNLLRQLQPTHAVAVQVELLVRVARQRHWHGLLQLWDLQLVVRVEYLQVSVWLCLCLRGMVTCWLSWKWGNTILIRLVPAEDSCS